jgi:glutamyl-tRNA synthetase
MIRTRFAPSPTGYLHIGGVRTALFNWLVARHHGGRFILRIDDTDQVRNVEAALAPILDGFRWLGIDWDEGPEVGGDYGPYNQSERSERYQAAAARLVADGLAYWDYASPDDLAVEREAAKAAKQNFIYSRRWMAESDADRRRFESEGRTGVVRLKMPREGACAFEDLIRGPVSFDWAREQDHVIQRADGSCLYHLASVVDDHEMAISHVIRAEEHLSNTARQIFIAQSLGYELPVYAHLPQVAEPGSKTKLSKRKIAKYLKHAEFARIHDSGVAIAEALGVDTSREDFTEGFNPMLVGFYETVGYLPDAIVNFLLLQGWALDDRTEFFSREEMVRDFSLERVNKAPASFDPVKLMAFQEHYMQALPIEERVARVLPYLVGGGFLREPLDAAAQEKVRHVVAAAGDRIRIAGDVLEFAGFFQGAADLSYVEKDVEKRLRKPDGAAASLSRFRDELAKAEPFDAFTLETSLKAFTEQAGIKLGQIIHPVRVAVTGSSVGFGLYEAMTILGREECLARIDRALSLIETP